MKKKLIIGLLSSVIASQSFACTDVNVSAKDGRVSAGRTMEWALDMGWQVQYMPKNTNIKIIQTSKSKSKDNIQIKTKYSFAGISTADYFNSFTDGQNEKGLSVSANFLPGYTQYESYNYSQPNKNISVIQAVEFILGSYSSVEDVKTNFSQYSVWYEDIPNLPISPSLHLLVTDKTGKSIVIEWIDGNMKIFDRSIGVMTNSPNYDWHLTNTKNYLNLNNKGSYTIAKTVNDKSISVSSLGQGSGGIGLPGDFTSPSRFIKVAYLQNYAKQPDNSQQAVQQVAHILNNVDIVNGTVVENGEHVYDEITQWITIKDLTNNKIYIADYDHRTNYVQIDLNKLFESKKPMSIKVNDIKYPTGLIDNPFQK